MGPGRIMEHWRGLYSLADCSRLLREPRETVREWTLKGLAPTRERGERISPVYDFPDLISLLVVSHLRKRGVPLQRIRTAEDYLRRECRIERPLATTRLYTAGKDVLVRESPGGGVDGGHQLVAVSRYGQGAIEAAFEAVLNQVHYSEGIASDWTPWVDVKVNPLRQFGAPCVTGTGIQTATLYGFIQAGDAPEYVADLYELPVERVQHAVEWEERLAGTQKKAA